MTVADRGRALRALLALPLLAVPAAAQASGFAIESQGARAMGFGGAYVAQAADPSAIFYNAAGIGFLKGKHLYIAGTFAGLSTDFTGSGPYPPAGTLESSSNGLGLLNQGFLETSNVNVVEELVLMITTQRAYEINSRAIQTSDQMLGRLTQL